MDTIKDLSKGIKKKRKARNRRKKAVKAIDNIEKRLKTAKKRFHKLDRRGTRYNLRNKLVYGGKTLVEWERDWEELGYIRLVNLSKIGDTLGLFRISLFGKVVYIGKSLDIEKGGLRQGISYFRRSARKGNYEKISKEDLRNAKLEILDLGNSLESESLLVILENSFKEKYNPSWN